MSREKLFEEIERLRSEMCSLAAGGAGYAKVLEASREMDRLIVEYHRTAAPAPTNLARGNPQF